MFYTIFYESRMVSIPLKKKYIYIYHFRFQKFGNNGRNTFLIVSHKYNNLCFI